MNQKIQKTTAFECPECGGLHRTKADASECCGVCEITLKELVIDHIGITKGAGVRAYGRLTFTLNEELITVTVTFDEDNCFEVTQKNFSGWKLEALTNYLDELDYSFVTKKLLNLDKVTIGFDTK